MTESKLSVAANDIKAMCSNICLAQTDDEVKVRLYLLMQLAEGSGMTFKPATPV